MVEGGGLRGHCWFLFWFFSLNWITVDLVCKKRLNLSTWEFCLCIFNRQYKALWSTLVFNDHVQWYLFLTSNTYNLLLFEDKFLVSSIVLVDIIMWLHVIYWTLFCSTTGARDPITSALHIVLGNRVGLDIAQVVRWKTTPESKVEPYVRYAASFAG